MKRVYIDKADGSKRPLGVPALEDKIVQKATVEVLNVIYEQDFLGFSYGLRPGKSAHNAQSVQELEADLQWRVCQRDRTRRGFAPLLLPREAPIACALGWLRCDDSRRVLEQQAVSQGGDERETAILPPLFGKTTLLRTLIGTLRATAATVTLNGTDITRAAPHARARLGIAYVPQGCEIFPALSVTDNLRMGLVETGQQGSDGIDRLLADFPRLKPALDRAGGSLSGGEQPPLALARALAGQSSLMLPDGPTEGIQASIIEEIGETLKALRDRMQLSIVLVEQNLQFIAAVSQRVRVIKRDQLGKETPRQHLGDLAIMSEYTGMHG